MGRKENYVFDKHPYRITKHKSGRWKTYIKDDLKGRKAVERNEKKDLINFLYNHYYAEEITAQSMTTVFEAFLAYKLDCENRSPETCERLRYTYKKFITDALGKRKMSVITKNELISYTTKLVNMSNVKAVKEAREEAERLFDVACIFREAFHKMNDERTQEAEEK